MLVDGDGTFLSQRTVPRMALIEVRDDAAVLTCRAPGMHPLVVPVPDAVGSTTLTAAVWDDSVTVVAAGVEPDAWFSEFLRRRCRLVHQPDCAVRLVTPAYSRPGDQVSLADAFPLLLIGQESLDELNTRLDKRITIDRFRPNVVVSGATPYAEDRWRRIRIGRVECELPKPCARCAVPAVDPETAAVGVEPTRTLATYRMFDGKVLFGMNALPRNRGTLSVGDPVVVLEAW
jgi:uncharacterized protein YcbX